MIRCAPCRRRVYCAHGTTNRTRCDANAVERKQRTAGRPGAESGHCAELFLQRPYRVAHGAPFVEVAEKYVHIGILVPGDHQQVVDLFVPLPRSEPEVRDEETDAIPVHRKSGLDNPARFPAWHRYVVHTSGCGRFSR